MKKLWAPWRMQYINSTPEEGCFLCRAWESDDLARHHVLEKGNEAFVIMNIHPYNNGHLMVASSAHKGELGELTDSMRAEMMSMVNRSIIIMKKAFSPHGFNVGINIGQVAGAGISEHLHIHIVPRWNGDTNYMPLLADVKVISEHIEDTYRKLHQYYKS